MEIQKGREGDSERGRVDGRCGGGIEGEVEN